MQIWIENLTPQMPVFKKKIVYMGLEFQVKTAKFVTPH